MTISARTFLSRAERPILLAVIGLLIIVVVLQAIVPRLVDDEEPAPTMAADSGSEVIRTLSSKGWDCFDSHGDALLKRCFANNADGSAASVSVLFDADTVAMIKADATGSDGDSITDSLSSAAEAMDAAFLPAGETRIKQLMTGKAYESRRLPGGTLAEATPSSLKMLNSADGGAPATTVYMPKALPLPDQLAFGLEQLGFSCHSEFNTQCDHTIDGVDVWISQDVRPIDPNMIEIRVGPFDDAEQAAGSKAEKVREKLGEILTNDSVGLTDAAGAEFLAQGPEGGHRGDFAGYAMTVASGVDGDSDSLKIDITSVVPEPTSAIEW